MDLRGFMHQNTGCVFEINTLIDHLPLDQVILTFNETTDQDFLQTTIQSAWQNLGNDSLNRNLQDSILTLFEYRSGENLPLYRLLEALCKAAARRV